MNKTIRSAPGLALAALLALSGAAPAHSQSTAESVANKASGVAVKVERAIERGVKAAASGVERGLTAAASGVQRGAQVAASGVERGARAASDAAGTAARKVGVAAKPASAPASAGK